MSPEKRLLMEHRLKVRAGRTRTIERRSNGLQPVLTDAQWRLLVLNEANEGLVAYNVAQAARVRGPLDVAALRRALDDLVERHAVLRSRFSIDDGAGRVEISDTAACDTRVERLTAGGLDAFVLSAITEPFDLSAGRLLRARIGTIAPNDHVLVLVTHHIVSDAVSKGVIGRDLDALYRAHRDGRTCDLAPMELDYFDYAAWQAERPDAVANLAWWQRTLAGAPEWTELPIDRAPTTAVDFRGARFGSRLDADLAATIRDYARTHGATAFMVLLAAFAGLLERHSAQGCVVTGSPTTGRHHDELKEVVGFFLNTLPIRVDTSDDPSFAELLERTRTAAVGAYRHQDVPFETIVEAVRPRRLLGRNPIFQSLFTLKEDADSGLTLDGLDFDEIRFDGGWTKVDLSVIASPLPGGGLSVLWQYATSLFDASTIERLAGQFERVLRTGLAAPDAPLSSLHLAATDDEASIAEWNDTSVELGPKLVNDLIARQVIRWPDRQAVGDATGWLTFSELDARANRLAHHLVQCGVGPDSRVAVFIDRSIDLEVALLAALKAGGAYLPLDTGYPAERLAFMLSDSAATVLITSAGLRSRAPAHQQTVVIDDIDLSSYPAEAPTVATTSTDLAYVLYTSGTTGRPKGVAMPHLAVVNQLDWMRHAFSIGALDTILQKTPISFDVAGWEVLLAPATGARLFMARPGGHRDPDYLIDTIREQAITTVNFVPSMYDVFLDRPSARRCDTLRRVIVAGEALTDQTAANSARVLPGAALWNVYGPTETIGITYELVRLSRSVTIGQPMQNCTAHVLDTALGEQPVGMAGELFLGGLQLARGYLGREELTSQRFIDTPIGRLYRTGDRAVWQPDGRLQYRGRLDDQVKLRGFRIELGEIEAIALECAAVRSACVVVTMLGSEPRLACYLALHDEVLRDASGSLLEAIHERTMKQVRERMLRKLPEHMVPTTLCVLDELPLGPSGKIDRRALSERLLAPTREAREYTPPRTETERRLARMWQDALGITQPISVTENFFDLGGSSITALRLFPRLERRFRVKLPLAMLFEKVTVESLAATIDAESGRRDSCHRVVELATEGHKGPLFLIPEIRGDALVYRQLVRHLDVDRPVYGLEFVGLDNRQLPRLTITEVAADCVASMRQVQPVGPYVIAGYCFGGTVAHQMAAQLLDEGEKIEFLGVIDATPFGRYLPEARPRKPTLRERFTVRNKATLLLKIRIVRMLVRDAITIRVLRLCHRFRMRPPVRFASVKTANIYAMHAYRSPEVDVHLDFFRASAGNTSADDLRRRRWELVAGHGVAMHVVHGENMTHKEIVRERYANLLAVALTERLREVP